MTQPSIPTRTPYRETLPQSPRAQVQDVTTELGCASLVSISRGKRSEQGRTNGKGRPDAALG